MRAAGLCAILLLLGSHPARSQAASGEVDSLSLSQGRRAMWRSAALDGWGQLENGDWLKALLFSAGEVSIVAGAVNQHNEWRRWQERRRRATDPLIIDFTMRREDFYLRDRNKLIWWWLWLKLGSVLDAYVSGSMSNFDAGWGDGADNPVGRVGTVLLPGGTPGLRLTLPLR